MQGHQGAVECRQGAGVMAGRRLAGKGWLHDDRLPCMISACANKVQNFTVAAGHGGCFPMHFDSDMQLDMRRITAVW